MEEEFLMPIDQEKRAEHFTKLLEAVIRRKKDLRFIKYCVENGADVNTRFFDLSDHSCEDSLSLLRYASLQYRDQETIQYLIDNGAKIDYETDHLSRLAVYASLQVLKCLFENGITFNKEQRKEALEEVIRQRLVCRVQPLLEIGTDPTPLKEFFNGNFLWIGSSSERLAFRTLVKYIFENDYSAYVNIQNIVELTININDYDLLKYLVNQRKDCLKGKEHSIFDSILNAADGTIDVELLEYIINALSETDFSYERDY
jgi:hypothetical protein